MSNRGLQPLILESVSAVTATPSIELGTERWENGRKYVYMYNKATSTATVGLGVVYSAASGYSVTISSVAGEYCAGVVREADIDPAYYGWIVTKGHVDVLAASAVALGNKLSMETDGYFTSQQDGTASGWTGFGAVGWQGVCTANTAATATMGAFIVCG